MPQNRDHFRIPFPIGERPQLLVGAAEFKVIDLSERGARIVRNATSLTVIGTPVAGLRMREALLPSARASAPALAGRDLEPGGLGTAVAVDAPSNPVQS